MGEVGKTDVESYNELGFLDQTPTSGVPWKGFLALFLASVANLIPEFAETIVLKLESTAVSLAKQCVGTRNQTVFGADWAKGYDELPKFGNSMNAVNLFVSKLLVPASATNISASVTNNTQTGDQIGNGTGTRTSGSAIAGAVVGAVIGATLIVGVIYWVLTRWRKRNEPSISTEEPVEINHQEESQAMQDLADKPMVAEMNNDGARYELPGNEDGGVTTRR